jgi:hypothetical protein
MRKELAKKEGERKKFRAIFSRFGKKANYHGYSEETILLKHIVALETNEVVADHVWFSYTKSFQQLDLKEGVTITFDARVKEYVKGYVNNRYKINQRTRDFRLSHPTQIKIVEGMSDT